MPLVIIASATIISRPNLLEPWFLSRATLFSRLILLWLVVEIGACLVYDHCVLQTDFCWLKFRDCTWNSALPTNLEFTHKGLCLPNLRFLSIWVIIFLADQTSEIHPLFFGEKFPWLRQCGLVLRVLISDHFFAGLQRCSWNIYTTHVLDLLKASLYNAFSKLWFPWPCGLRRTGTWSASIDFRDQKMLFLLNPSFLE